MALFDEFKVPVFTGINDISVVPTNTSAGNGSDLISRLNGLITQLAIKFDATATQINTLTSAIAALQNAPGPVDNSAAISTLVNRITVVENTIASLPVENDHSSDITSINSQLATLTALVTTLNTRIATLESNGGTGNSGGGTSGVNAPTGTTLPTLPGLLLAVSSDGLSSGALSNWEDQSPQGNNLLQPDATRRPTVISNSLNGKPIVRFGDIKCMNFTRLNNIRSVYWVLKFADNLSGMLLGDSTTISFYGTNSGYFLGGGYAADTVLNGDFKRNGEGISPYTQRDTSWVTLSLVTTADVAANSLAADRNSQYGQYSINADIAALYIYSEAHTPSQVASMETYLKNKYQHYT